MEHTDFKQLDLFANKCHTRKGGHASEINAGDKATVTLKKDLRDVLRLVNEYDGCDAKMLGVYLAYGNHGGEVVTILLLPAIQKDLDLPHKKLSKLVAKGYVRIEEVKGSDNKNWITDAGRKALK